MSRPIRYSEKGNSLRRRLRKQFPGASVWEKEGVMVCVIGDRDPTDEELAQIEAFIENADDESADDKEMARISDVRDEIKEQFGDDFVIRLLLEAWKSSGGTRRDATPLFRKFLDIVDPPKV
jgi:hypothetical protein